MVTDYKECTDCVHYELCLHQEKFLIEHNRKDLIRRYGFGLCEPENCCNFKDRHRFVDQSRGFWIPANLRPKSVAFMCSICGGKAYDRPYGSSKIATKKPCGLKFCPNCGAKMTITDDEAEKFVTLLSEMGVS